MRIPLIDTIEYCFLFYHSCFIIKSTEIMMGGLIIDIKIEIQGEN